MDKHKGHKHDAKHAGKDKHEDIKKRADNKQPDKDESHDMPGAAGFRSAGAEEDTYD